MALLGFRPLRELEEMRSEMDRLLADIYRPQRGRWLPPHGEPGAIVPAVDMVEKKDSVVVSVELPGVGKEDIDLKVTADSLTISGEFKKDEDAQEGEYHVAERRYGPFKRSLNLPAEVDSSKARATFTNGVLKVALPKKEETLPKEIKVEVA